jgi:hypothetical protein
VRLAGANLRRHHANRIAANVDCCVAGHVRLYQVPKLRLVKSKGDSR